MVKDFNLHYFFHKKPAVQKTKSRFTKSSLGCTLFLGMSTIPEVLVARHCGISVFAFSLITNECIMKEDADEKADHEEVIATANKRQDHLKAFVKEMVIGIHETKSRNGSTTSSISE